MTEILDSASMKEQMKSVVSKLFEREAKKHKPNVGTLEYYRTTMIDLESSKQSAGFK